MAYKAFSFLAFTLVSALFFSCGENKEKTATETMSSDTSVSVTDPTPAAPSTIVTTPEHILMVRNKVADFAKWKVSYDGRDSARLASGMHNYVVARGVEDTNLVLVALKADDMAKAKAFTADPALRQAMKKGGMTGTPSFSYVTWVFQDNAQINTPLRSMTTFTVKDFDAWQKAFQEGKQERLDNGIMERAYGYDPENNKKVTLVTAIMDSAKAAAYWKSDILKNRRAAAGVTSEPERLLIRIIQRY